MPYSVPQKSRKSPAKVPHSIFGWALFAEADGLTKLESTANLDRIVAAPDIRFGKATVRGTRLTVDDVLGLLAEMSEAELFNNFPRLAADDVKTRWAYTAECERRTPFVANNKERYRL